MIDFILNYGNLRLRIPLRHTVCSIATEQLAMHMTTGMTTWYGIA
jgi:hypothetical protein